MTMSFDEFVLVRLLPGPGPTLDGDERMRVQDAHLAHLHALWQRGLLIPAGPAENASGIDGIAIMTCPIDEARMLSAQDPGVLAGVFTPEVTAWRVPAGMLIGGPGTPPTGVADVLGTA